MKKTKIAVVICLVSALFLGSFLGTKQSTIKTEASGRFLETIYHDGWNDRTILRDKRTGVNYPTIEDNHGDAISVMYDKDGKILVTDKEGNITK